MNRKRVFQLIGIIILLSCLLAFTTDDPYGWMKFLPITFSLGIIVLELSYLQK